MGYYRSEHFELTPRVFTYIVDKYSLTKSTISVVVRPEEAGNSVSDSL